MRVLAVATLVAALHSSGGLSGTYRATVTAAALRATGVPAQEASFDAGTWTLVLGNGRWTMRQTHGVLGNAFAEGDLQVKGSRALFTLRRIDGVPHHEFAGTVTWRRTGSKLRFARAGVAWIYEMFVLVAQPWARTG
jgi:hypothetical protein